ncbi:MAG TPA: lyase family protein, partial [Clostridia bacterium]|nr:lyase family protein [Clostridia bacterium]
KIAHKMGFEGCYAVSGQTYSRKVDYNVLGVLSMIAQSAHKFSNDIRLLSHLKELDEPFESEQIGSSAMPYKRNPMRSERIASLARYIMSDMANPAFTAASQWFERTLDDSANRRISIPEAFLAADAVLTLTVNIARGARVYPGTIKKHLADELPFMASENILMYCVSKKGGDRQALHEALRAHSVAAAERVKLYGEENDLLQRILADGRFGLTEEELDDLLDPASFTGRAAKQTEEYLAEIIRPLLAQNREQLGAEICIKV